MHIHRVPAPLPPHALPAPAFRFRQLACCAGRLPIGGAREVALAAFVAARLLADAANVGDGALELSVASRAARCSGAKAWLGALALPAPIRASVLRCAETSAESAKSAMAAELATLNALVQPYLDAGACSELDSLATLLA